MIAGIAVIARHRRNRKSKSLLLIARMSADRKDKNLTTDNTDLFFPNHS